MPSHASTEGSQNPNEPARAAQGGKTNETQAIQPEPRLRRADVRKQGIFFCLIAAGFLWSMATKPTPGSGFVFETGMRDNGSYATNSTVHIAWTLTNPIPHDAPVYIEYRQRGTGGEYAAFGETTVGAYSWTTNGLANATNFDYNVWYYYIPPSPVHTNGTWQYRTNRTRDNRFVLPAGATIKEN